MDNVTVAAVQGIPQSRLCAVCGRPLVGRQTVACSRTCSIAWQKSNTGKGRGLHYIRPPCQVCGEPIKHRQRLSCGRPECKAIVLARPGNTWNVGTKHSEEHKAKIAAGSKAAWQRPEYREKVVRLAAEGTRTPEARAKYSAGAIRMWQRPEAVQHAAKVVQNSHYARHEYLDCLGRLWMFKSGDEWERGFARLLDAHELNWRYEPDTLLLSDGRRYVPDFWIEEWQTYVELKASHRPHDKTEIAAADGYPILLLKGHDVKEFFVWTR